MKVKIGDKVYDQQEQPIMVIMTPQDKENIAKMSEQCNQYCACPDNMNEEDFDLWLDTVDEDENL